MNKLFSALCKPASKNPQMTEVQKTLAREMMNFGRTISSLSGQCYIIEPATGHSDGARIIARVRTAGQQHITNITARMEEDGSPSFFVIPPSGQRGRLARYSAAETAPCLVSIKLWHKLHTERALQPG